MKKQIVAILVMASMLSCSTASKCPTTQKRHFTKGIKGSKPLYKGYGTRK